MVGGGGERAAGGRRNANEGERGGCSGGVSCRCCKAPRTRSRPLAWRGVTRGILRPRAPRAERERGGGRESDGGSGGWSSVCCSVFFFFFVSLWVAVLLHRTDWGRFCCRLKRRCLCMARAVSSPVVLCVRLQIEQKVRRRRRQWPSRPRSSPRRDDSRCISMWTAAGAISVSTTSPACLEREKTRLSERRPLLWS